MLFWKTHAAKYLTSQHVVGCYQSISASSVTVEYMFSTIGIIYYAASVLVNTTHDELHSMYS